MQVRIGVQFVAKELVVETRMSAEEVEHQLREALATEQGLLVLKDDKGGRIAVPAGHIGYVELTGDETRQVGFGTL